MNNAQVHRQNFKEGRGREKNNGGDRKRVREGKWKKPPQNTIKMSCDVVVLGEGRVGLGFLIRDGQANIVLAGKKKKKREETVTGNNTLLEGYTMNYAMR